MDRTLRVVLVAPPAGVDFGVQKGRGNPYETILTQRSTGDDLVFEFNVELRPDSDFGGPIVQGPRGGRFIYIDIGTYAGQAGTPWGRRLKIPLTGIPAEAVASGSLLEARVPGTGKDGGPNCATVKPFAGWSVKTRGV